MQIKKNYRRAGLSRGIKAPTFLQKITKLENIIGRREKPVDKSPNYLDWLKNV